MEQSNSTIAQQLAEAASEFEHQRTGHAPQSLSVVLIDQTLVITLHGALSPAENALAQTPQGATRVQEYYRQLFASSCAGLRQEIRRITGVDVRESSGEVGPTNAAVVQAFTTGTVVQVFLLARSVPPDTWSGSVTLRKNV